jgi:DDE superfamily endonuclease
VLLSQDEARFPLVPTLHATLGVKGYRPMVGTWDNKEQVYCLAALNLVTGQLTTRVLEQPARSQTTTGHSKQPRLQGAFAAHLQDSARLYPATTSPEVVITIDNAPWHGGARVEAVLAAHPHLRVYRLPSYSPQLNVMERFWRVLRRRATHNRLFTSMAAWRSTLRNNSSYFQPMRHKVLSLIESPRKAKKEAKLAAA